MIFFDPLQNLHIGISKKLKEGLFEHMLSENVH